MSDKANKNKENSDHEPTTPHESNEPNPQGAVSADYAELTRLASYGDTLHTERTRFWMMTHAVFIAFLGVSFQHLTKSWYWFYCFMGMALCICWILTVCRISKRLNWLNTFILENYAGSPHALWLRFGKPADKTTEKTKWSSATLVFTWIVPALFIISYICLGHAKLSASSEKTPDSLRTGTITELNGGYAMDIAQLRFDLDKVLPRHRQNWAPQAVPANLRNHYYPA